VLREVGTTHQALVEPDAEQAGLVGVVVDLDGDHPRGFGVVAPAHRELGRAREILALLGLGIACRISHSACWPRK
jgi:hypothetical protein